MSMPGEETESGLHAFMDDNPKCAFALFLVECGPRGESEIDVETIMIGRSDVPREQVARVLMSVARSMLASAQ